MKRLLSGPCSAIISSWAASLPTKTWGRPTRWLTALEKALAIVIWTSVGGVRRMPGDMVVLCCYVIRLKDLVDAGLCSWKAGWVVEVKQQMIGSKLARDPFVSNGDYGSGKHI